MIFLLPLKFAGEFSRYQCVTWFIP